MKRESLFYSGRALKYGVGRKKPEEAIRRFQAVIDYGMKDELMEFSIGAIADIHYNYGMLGRKGFSLKIAEKNFSRLVEEFPNGKYKTFAQSRIREIERVMGKPKNK